MNHIILIGFMGSGKTSVGKKLAKNMKLEFVDTDKMIEEQSHMKVSEIFEEHGEEYFRSMETLTLRQLLDCEERLVISVGGGLPIQPQNREYLKMLGSVIYLKASTQTLTERLKGDKSRPLLAEDPDESLSEKIDRLKSGREDIYKEVADFEIATDNKGFRKIIEEIKKNVR